MKTTIDCLKFRTTSEPRAIFEAIRPAMGFIDPDLVTLSDTEPGKDGWKWRRNIMIAGDVVMAMIDYGGEHQRGKVRCHIPGSGCAWVQDWSVIESIPHHLAEATIMRLDIALTTYEGEVTHDMVIKAHDDLQFGTGGRHPHRKEVVGSDPTAGRTVYVGKRKSAKYLRCYEKGLEIMSKLPEQIRQFILNHKGMIQVDGIGHHDPLKMYRVEVEFKDEDNRVVPWEAIGQRDEFFAGAYPFCASLLPGVPERVIKGLPEVKAKIELATQLEHLRRSYGSTIKAAIMAYGGNRDRVLDIITSDKPSHNLIASGVLLVDHE